MKLRFFVVILLLTFIVGLFFIYNQNTSKAQTLPNGNLYMFGSLEKNNIMTGFFGRNRQDLKNKNWCVFIGANGKVYKLSLIERSIGELFIDGHKISDNEIWKHNAEYKPFLERFWRNEEIEQESQKLELLIKPIDQKIEKVAKEIEKLDRMEEKLERQENSLNIAENKKNLNDEQKRLSEIEKTLNGQIENLSKQQEKLSNEQESLKLMDDLEKVLQQIGEDLKSLGVIKNKKNLSYKLSNKEFIVNGKPGSPEVFELLKNRYIVEFTGESGFLYRWKW